MPRSLDHPSRELTRAGVLDLLRDACWAALPVATIESLIEGGRVAEFAAGCTVYAEADAAGLAVLLQGLLRVYMHASDGRQVTVRYVRGGDLLGVPALVGGPSPVFVQAITSSAAFLFDGDRVKRIARKDALVAWAFAQESVHRLYDVLEELAGNAFASVRQRVARHLLDLAASHPAADGRLTALVSQQDLANSVGSVREVVARVLADLRAEGLVQTSAGRVDILDPVQMSRQLWSRARDESHSG
jgi:CRP/FNR family transcriptional regulator, cyclic AMP receptor protein